MRPRITPIVLVVVATLLVEVDLGWAGAPTERLRIFFIETNAIIRGADRDRGTEARRTALRALVDDVFDFSGAAARTLGPEWHRRTPHEQEEFVRLFADLLERGYVAMLGSKVRVRGGLSINFVGESVEGNSATVTTTMLTRVGNELPVSYRLARHGARWAVQDVAIDGVSLVGNYRAQFRRVLQASSYGELMAQMRDKVSDSPTAASTPAPAVTDPKPPTVREEHVSTVAPDTSAPALTAPEPPTAPKSQVAEAIEPPAEAAATKKSSASKTTPVQVRYWVQLGAFRTADAASRLAERLRSRVANVSTTSPALTDSDPVGLVRVLVGPFAKRAQAVAKLRELEKRGYRGFIVAETRDP